MTYSPRDVPGLRERTRRMWSTPIGEAFATIDLDRSYGDRKPGYAKLPDGTLTNKLAVASRYEDNADFMARRNGQLHGQLHPMRTAEGWGAQTTEQYCRGQDQLLREAELYWINQDMSTLLRHAANELPPCTISTDDVPHDSGFVVFEEDIPGIDSTTPDNDKLRIAAFGWGLVVVQGIRALHMEFYDLTSRLFTPVERQLRGEDGLGELYFLGASAWEIGTQSDDFTGFYSPASNLAKSSFLEDRRLVQAFFLLIRQQIAAVNVRSPDRAERRRAARSGYTVMPDVRVVTLREQYHATRAPAGTSQVDWSHRWMVSGYWQNHWWPSKGIHIPTYIHAHPRGPKDKPLVIRPTVRALKR